MAKTKTEVRACRVCGCTDNDCRQCIKKTGEPCHWVDEDLCSACVVTKRDPIYLRLDRGNLFIKIKSEGIHAHGWKILERGFIDYDMMLTRLKELLRTGEFIEG